MKWLDLNRNGRLDSADLLIGAAYLCAAIIGLTLMFSTWARSFHLLSSPQMNPNVFALWPWITSLAPEAGFLLAYLCVHAGIRKQYLVGVILGGTGMTLFMVVIATMQWYDVELVRGASLSEVGKWADYVASFVALITIVYAAVVTNVIEYVNTDSRIVNAPHSGYDKSRRPISRPTIGSADPMLELPDETHDVARDMVNAMVKSGNGAGEGHPQKAANFPQRQPLRR